MAMVVKKFEYEVPSIHVYYSKELKDLESFEEVLWGIEEEGIPYEVESFDFDSSLELGYLGAEKSKLGVGIGIDKMGKITLAFNKLAKKKPLFTANVSDETYVLRALGGNAGRLVKGIEFK